MRKLLKHPECKKYIQYSDCKATVFSGQAQSCLKILNGKKCIQYSENFQGTLCFSGQAQGAKISWM